MALRFAILTALTERASTGQELARRFDRSIGYFWTATHQQIYRELAGLRANGLVSEAPTPHELEQGQPRPVAITEAGTRELRRWLHTVDGPTRTRESLIVRVRAAASIGELPGVRSSIAHHLESHEASLARYRAIEADDFGAAVNDSAAMDAASDPEVLQRLVLQAGLSIETAWVTWCRDALDAIDGLLRRQG